MRNLLKKSLALILAVMTVFSVTTAFAASTDKIEIDENGVLTLCSVSGTILDMSAEVKEIGENAFRDCPNLQEIVIGPNVKYIGTDAFTGCANLKIIYFGLTNSIDIMDRIADKNKVTFVIDNRNTAVRKAIATGGYNWCSYQSYEASGKDVLSFLYGASKDFVVLSDYGKRLVNQYKPDYVYFENDNSYYLAQGRTANEVDYSSKVNPGFFLKFSLNMELNKLPDKADVNSGNDRAKNAWIKIFNAIAKAFK